MMKTKISLLVLTIAAIGIFNCVDAFAQPGNPSSCSGSTWNLTASASTIANGGTVSIYANYQGASGTCPWEGTITVNKGTSNVSVSPTLPVGTNIPECNGEDPDAVCAVNGPLLIRVFTLTHSQGTAQQITFNITGITGGHSAGSGVTVTVNP